MISRPRLHVPNLSFIRTIMINAFREVVQAQVARPYLNRVWTWVALKFRHSNNKMPNSERLIRLLPKLSKLGD